MQTPDLTEGNITKIEELFPNVITEKEGADGVVEKAIDFELLKQMLSKELVEDDSERYRLDWPGKKASLLKANTPITSTLRPDRESSVNFDTTENVFIEGDNFEVLKVLQESYLGKVKMIYIDPPYNTGSDFVYKDNFAQDKDEYDEEIGAVDDEDNKLFRNTESNGRFHSDWISMMYERLIVTRDLLSEDGVIFISIDDNEVHNLRKIADEIFGENNFVANIIWQKKFSRANDATYFSTMHDHILVYVKKSLFNSQVGWKINLLPRNEDVPAGYANPDDDSRGLWTSVVLSAKSGSKNLLYEITIPSGKKCMPPNGRYWSVNQEKFKQLVSDNRIWFGVSGDGIPRVKTFLSEVQDGLRPNSIWMHEEVGHNQEGKQEVKKIFDGDGYFDSPKPVRLIKHILKIATNNNDLVLDFFAGSSTTAHAVIGLNAEDGGNRKFIMVQLPEETDKESEAFKAGYKTISSLGMERIRRSGQKILDENKEELSNRKMPLDIGFRVYKIDTTNMKDVYYHPSAIDQKDLFNQVSNIKEDRTPEDLLTQVILDLGLTLDLPIEKKNIKDNDVYFVSNNALVACFDDKIDFSIVDDIAKLEPLKVVFKDGSFKEEQDRTNIETKFKRLSPDTIITVL